MTTGEYNPDRPLDYSLADYLLGRLEGIASDYGNLGGVYEERGDIERAREYGEKAVEIFKKIGMPHRVEEVEGWIGGLE